MLTLKRRVVGCFWHFQFTLSRPVMCSQPGSSEGKYHHAQSATSREARCYSFCPTEWQRQAKYLLINLTRCRSGCWLSISRVYLVCARKPSPCYHRTAHTSNSSDHSDSLATWSQHLRLTLRRVFKNEIKMSKHQRFNMSLSNSLWYIGAISLNRCGWCWWL